MSEEEEIIPTTDQTLWLSPSMAERVEWDEARRLVRDQVAAYSGLQVPQYEIDQAIRRSISRAYPRSFMVLVHQGVIDAGYVDSIALPWPAEQLLFFGLTGTEPGMGSAASSVLLGTGAVDLNGTRIRFLFDECYWPYTAQAEVTFTARVITKPQQETVCPDYCSLPPDVLVLLAEHELWPFFARSEGMNQTAITAQQRLNWESLMNTLPRRRVPSRLRFTGMQTVSSTVFHSWGQEDITFGDLG